MIKIIKEAKVLFIGIGTMGHPMCLNLSKAGYQVDAFNRTYKNARSLNEQGINVLKKIPDRLNYDVIISIVSDDRASENVFFGNYAVLEKLKPDTVVLECSTLSPDYILRLNDAVKNKSAVLIDAPVSGSLPEAIDKTLLFLAGGDKQVIEFVEPLLLTMGEKVYQMGEVGNGVEMKLINNILNGIQMIALGEAMLLAEKCKIDFRLFAEIISNGQPGSPIIKAKLKKLLSNEPSPVQAKIEIIRKDIMYALQIARKHDIVLMLTSAAANVFSIVGKVMGSEDVVDTAKLFVNGIWNKKFQKHHRNSGKNRF